METKQKRPDRGPQDRPLQSSAEICPAHLGPFSRTVFDHIPKTGGISITVALERGLGEQNTRQNSLCPHHIVVASAGGRRAICSHLWFYAGEPLVSGWFYATLLRDPVDRFLSHYYFYLQLRQQILDGSVSDPGGAAAVHHDSLENFLLDQSHEVRRTYSNIQAAHFAARTCERPYELKDSQLLDAAVASLKEYDLVGVYPELGLFLDRYCDSLQIPRQQLPRENVTPGRKSVHEISQGARQRVIAANMVDLALVDWARHHYSSQRSPTTRAAAAGTGIFGTREIKLVAVENWGTQRGSYVIRQAERVRVRVKCRSSIREDDLTVGIGVYSAEGREMLAASSKSLGLRLAVSEESDFIIRVEFDALFATGDYLICLALVRGVNHLERCFHWVSGVTRFRVESGPTSECDSGSKVTFAIEEAPRPQRLWRNWSRRKPTIEWRYV